MGQKSIITTTDFFYPLVDDPYLMGQITCANVLSDIYTMGITNIDHILMLLGISTSMNEKEQEVSTTEIIKGFENKVKEAKTRITGGQTVYNPFPIIGGVGVAIVNSSDIIYPGNAKVGDLLILTKPLGTRVVVNLMQWYKFEEEKWIKAMKYISEEDLEKAYELCCLMMSELNYTAALLMQKYKARGATDITGFGILGHAKNLAESQKDKVNLRIHTLPIIHMMNKLHDKIVDYKLLEGYCAETSGGLLVISDPSQADNFVREFKTLRGHEAYIIGEIVKGEREAFIDSKPKIINVE